MYSCKMDNMYTSTITLDMFVPLILRHLIVAYSESKMLSIITLEMVNINCIYIYIGMYKHAYISLGCYILWTRKKVQK